MNVRYRRPPITDHHNPLEEPHSGRRTGKWGSGSVRVREKVVLVELQSSEPIFPPPLLPCNGWSPSITG